MDFSYCTGAFDYNATIAVTIVSCVLGIAWAGVNFVLVRKINVKNDNS